MQFYLLLMMMALFSQSSEARGMGGEDWGMGDGEVLLWTVLPYVLIVLVGWVVTLRTVSVLNCDPERGLQWIRRCQRVVFLGLFPLVVLVFVGEIFLLGSLGLFRAYLWEAVLLPDLVFLCLPVGSFVLMWSFYFPVERRSQEVMLLRRFDLSEPVAPTPTRGQYVTDKIRHQLLLVLAPLLVMLAYTQGVGRVLEANTGWHMAAMFGGAAVVFMLAPLLIRYTWRTMPLPDGGTREMLLGLCASQKIRISELLLWQTHSGMVNGAVMGLIPKIRYILLTDGLIERLDDVQIQAVMAHELGHIKRRHMPWMIVTAIASLMWIVLLMDGMNGLIQKWLGVWIVDPAGNEFSVVEGLVLFLVIVGWMLVFGYFSRRFERQADTFAVQELSRVLPVGGGTGERGEAEVSEESEEMGERAEEGLEEVVGGGEADGDEEVERDSGGEVVRAEAVVAMTDALQTVARLNHMPMDHGSRLKNLVHWRHGSIRWRTDYLRTLVGVRLDACGIDRTVIRVKVFSAVALVVAIVIDYWWSGAW